MSMRRKLGWPREFRFVAAVLALREPIISSVISKRLGRRAVLPEDVNSGGGI